MLQQPPLPAPMGPDAVEEPDSPPPPPHARTALAAKALMFLSLATSSVASTSLGAAAVVEAFPVPGCEEGCEMNDMLLSGFMAASLFTVLFALVAGLLVWRAGFRVEFTKNPYPCALHSLELTEKFVLVIGDLAAGHCSVLGWALCGSGLLAALPACRLLAAGGSVTYAGTFDRQGKERGHGRSQGDTIPGLLNAAQVCD
ncbi:hypothetical protein EJB05_49067, partial [Eragrostis curvula]